MCHRRLNVAGVTVQKTEGMSERHDTLETGGRSVNAETDWGKTSWCRPAGVMTEIITLILGLRVKLESEKRIRL